MTDDKDVVELTFEVEGGAAPIDHRYLLHAAVKTQCCRRMTERGWQLRELQGGEQKDDLLMVGDDTRLQIRCPLDDLDMARSLCDAPMRLGDHILMADEPVVSELAPASALTSSCVYIQNSDRGPTGLRAGDLGAMIGKRLGRQFGRIDFGVIMGSRVHFQCKGHELHGSACRVAGLSDEESLWLQRHGLGQKTSWGCGTFWAV